MEKTKTYQFEFGFFNIADMVALNKVAILCADGMTPAAVNMFVEVVKRFALFDIDSEPMDAMPLIIDDFAKAYKMRYEGLRD